VRKCVSKNCCFWGKSEIFETKKNAHHPYRTDVVVGDDHEADADHATTNEENDDAVVRFWGLPISSSFSRLELSSLSRRRCNTPNEKKNALRRRWCCYSFRILRERQFRSDAAGEEWRRRQRRRRWWFFFKVHPVVAKASAKRAKRGAAFEVARCGALEQADGERRDEERDGYLDRFVCVHGDVGVHRLVYRCVQSVAVEVM
jgi:hypothetical protein